MGQPAGVSSGPLCHIKGAHGVSYGRKPNIVFHLHDLIWLHVYASICTGEKGMVANEGGRSMYMGGGGVPLPWRGSQLPWVVA